MKYFPGGWFVISTHSSCQQGNRHWEEGEFSVRRAEEDWCCSLWATVPLSRLRIVNQASPRGLSPPQTFTQLVPRSVTRGDVVTAAIDRVGWVFLPGDFTHQSVKCPVSVSAGSGLHVLSFFTPSHWQIFCQQHLSEFLSRRTTPHKSFTNVKDYL